MELYQFILLILLLATGMFIVGVIGVFVGIGLAQAVIYVVSGPMPPLNETYWSGGATSCHERQRQIEGRVTNINGKNRGNQWHYLGRLPN